MDLPGSSISVSAIQGHRDCPRRFSYARIKRDPEKLIPDSQYAPEGGSMATGYGRAIHAAIRHVHEHHCSDDAAIAGIFPEHARWLEASDIERLRADLRTYRQRDYLGVRTVASERSVKIPLFNHNGTPIVFNARLDRLYQSLTDAGRFLYVDYKSGKWRKTEDEVRADPQFRAYDWLIHQFWPECETLSLIHDQLRFGTVVVRFNAKERAETHEWLVLQTVAILEDEDWQPDGLLRPTFNQWCPYCPLAESCPVVANLSDYAKTVIMELAPPVKDGRKTTLELDRSRLPEYVAELDQVDQARKVLDRFSESVRGLLRQLPDSEREQHGYRLQTRRNEFWTPSALAAIHRELGDDFYELIALSKTQLESYFGDGGNDELRERLLALRQQVEGASFVTKASDGGDRRARD